MPAALLAATLLTQVSIAEFTPAPGPLDNPLKGWAPYAFNGQAYALPHTMAFHYVSWRELEPAEGDYQFTKFERRWETEGSRGRHVILRLYMDYPNQPNALPTYLIDQGVKQTRYVTKEVGNGYSPDYRDPRLLAALEKLIAKMGVRYNRDPRVAFLQLGTLGFWGEWHTWPRESLFAPPEVQRRVINAYRRAFPNKHIMARYPGGELAPMNWLGFHDDMFPEDTDPPAGTRSLESTFLPMMRKSGLAQRWRTAPIGGEMVPRAAKRFLGPEWETTKRALELAHFSWVGPYGPSMETLSATERTRAEWMVRRMGYNFVLNTADFARNPDHLLVQLRGTNTGVAPFYYRWPVRLAYIKDRGLGRVFESNVDIRTWQPGPFSARIKLPLPQAGESGVALGVIDPMTNRPAIRFANTAPRIEGYTVLASNLY
ncbi:MAG: DUF4832 domain-containing protein [Fimbriimonadaceae bacterium]|nr:DUF4832 domain-containing protein [Fimbriimonadaceae bacterium]